MIDKSRARLDFPGFRFPEFLIFCLFISLMLFANAFFTGVPMTKAAYDALIADFQAKLVASFNSTDKNLLNARDQAYNALIAATRKLASYVDMMCGGDRVKIALSGFNVFSPESYPGQVLFSVIQGVISGQVIGEWPKDPNNHGYILRYAINEDGLRDIFTEVNAGITTCTINNLNPLKEYMFSYCVVYSTGKGEFSDPVFLTVI